MASISKDAKGNRRIQFVDVNKSRRSIALGKRPLDVVREIKGKVEKLNAAAVSGGRMPIDRETAEWLANLDPGLHAKLAAVDLVPHPPEPENTTLGPFIDAYIDRQTHIKDNTRDHKKRVRRNLVDFFGADKPLLEITAGDADEFRLHLRKTMADNTARIICRRAKEFLNVAVRKKLIPESPFADMKGLSVRANKDREYFVSRDDTNRVLEACPDAEWRLIVVLVRYGGLRCPSEPLALRWGDVDWERGRIRVPSPKTEHHEGKESRWIPIFPEVRPHLEAAFDSAKSGTEFVIARYRAANANLRTQFNRIVRKAGLEPWQKPFQNLRSTRETELMETFPAHVVFAWLGNSEAVARKHYLQVTDAHFERASGNAVQKSVQYPAVRGGTGQTPEGEKCEFTEEYDTLPRSTAPEAPPVGLEQALILR